MLDLILRLQTLHTFVSWKFTMELSLLGDYQQAPNKIKKSRWKQKQKQYQHLSLMSLFTTLLIWWGIYIFFNFHWATRWQLPPRKIAPRLGLGLGLVLGLGVIFLKGNCPRTEQHIYLWFKKRVCRSFNFWEWNKNIFSFVE